MIFRWGTVHRCCAHDTVYEMCVIRRCTDEGNDHTSEELSVTHG